MIPDPPAGRQPPRLSPANAYRLRTCSDWGRPYRVFLCASSAAQPAPPGAPARKFVDWRVPTRALRAAEHLPSDALPSDFRRRR